MEPELAIGTFRPDRPGVRKVLGDLEAEIMELIWARPVGQGTTVREVFEALYERRRLAYTTVMNTMTRLARKRLLRAEKADQAYVYFPNFTQEEFIARFVGRILEDLVLSFGGAVSRELEQMSDPAMRRRAEQLLAELERRRTAEEA
ncbi:MAG: BlaI/MecI/CopY family transcriptional regulator [Chloroflexi bacterium]|nr:BlaI/MecI/CopY family transcriptional regulator [Chloroflexota bacterium]